MVLQAKSLPYLMQPQSGLIFVPPLVLGVAVAEIRAFEGERPHVPPQAAGADNWLWVLAFLSLLLLWDGLRHGADRWGLASLPWDPRTWVDLGGLERARVAAGEWWRFFTALTLHADAAHLLGNFLFGAVFLLPLCRRAGLGAGLFLAVAGGALGNLMNSLFQQPDTVSLGFSSAVFAALGALCGLAVHDALPAAAVGSAAGPGRRYALTGRSIFISLAVGVAFLAFLGGSGEPRIDFRAHVLGLAGGFLLALGLSLAPFFRSAVSRRSRPLQALCLLLALGLPALSWYLAFLRYWRG